MSLIQIFLFILYIGNVLGAYTLKDDYNLSNFFDKWNFHSDDTSGTQQYVDRDTATANGYVGQNDGAIYIGMDSVNTTRDKRMPVRLESINYYTQGLFILDLNHMPGGICAGAAGEMDIIEQANDGTKNEMGMHNFNGGTCTLTVQDANQYGVNYEKLSCNNDIEGDYGGCAIDDSRETSLGTGFNKIGGGVFAVEWTNDFLKIWFFERNSTLLQKALADTPDPIDGWGKPAGLFVGDYHFKTDWAKQIMILNTALCGSWAGDAWGSSPTCSKLASTCADYVLGNPAVFGDAYWSINSLKVFEDPSNQCLGRG